MYTHFFAFGFLYAFETVFKGYPVPNEWEALFEAAVRNQPSLPPSLPPSPLCFRNGLQGLPRPQ